MVFAEGSHLWSELVLLKYDPVRVTKDMDWKLLYQSRNWAERRLAHGGYEFLDEGKIDPPWRVSGQMFVRIVCDMILENGTSC
jgi:hypothetical protein